MSEVRVTFPGVPGGSTLPARVIDLHCWEESDGSGDVAVIELDGPAPVEPCELSGPDALEPRPDLTSYELRAHGFPHRHDHDGISVTLRASGDRALREEWLEIDVDKAHLQRLGQGFSGAGVWIAGSGLVAGMVTSVALSGDGDGFNGRMLPMSTIRCYWEEADDFLPLDWPELPSRQGRRELRAAVAGAALTTSLGMVLKTVFPTFLRGQDFRTLWAAIRYAAEDGYGEDSLQLFLSRLAAYLDDGTRSRLLDWGRRWLPAAVGEFERAKAPVTSIVITLRTPMRGAGKNLELTAGPQVGGIPTGVPRKYIVPRNQLQAKVEKVITAQVNQLPSPDWMLEFAVEPNEMGLPFDEWRYHEPGEAESWPMRSVPLVVWDVSRLDLRKKFMSARARQRWETLRARGTTDLVQVCCKLTYNFEEFRDWLAAETNLCAIAYGVPPKREWLNAALKTGIPIMIWSRQDCSGGEEHHVHEEFLCQITAALSATDPDRLPAEVMRLRKEARSPATGGERHLGRHLTLIWDHPARLPDPPLAEGD